MDLFGKSDPTGGDGYIAGAWDEVGDAFMDGHISDEAYEALRAALNTRIEITERMGRPTECRVIVDDVVRFDGVDRSVLLR
ncbi:MAG: hypothetical protein HOV97_05870 [Nonomuraea sp.]|nr:hypothetical protein [Nonomuraea sp.]